MASIDKIYGTTKEFKEFSACPANYPSYSEYKLSILEAMREFILMTDKIEEWEIDEDFGWRDFLRNL